jgi:hypothetical protein
MLAFLFTWQTVLARRCVLASGYIGFAHYAAYLWPRSPIGAGCRASSPRPSASLTLACCSIARSATVARIGIALAGDRDRTLARSSRLPFDASRPRKRSRPIRTRHSAGLAAGLGPALVITLYDYLRLRRRRARSAMKCARRARPAAFGRDLGPHRRRAVRALQLGVLGSCRGNELVAPRRRRGNAPPSAELTSPRRSSSNGLGLRGRAHRHARDPRTAFASTFGNLLAYSRIPIRGRGRRRVLPPFARPAANAASFPPSRSSRSDCSRCRPASCRSATSSTR